MSISGISSNSYLYDLLSSSNTASTSSSSGKYSGATGGTAVDGSNDSSSSNSITTDLNVLLQALASGNLSSAQNSYSQLMQDVQSISSTDSVSKTDSSASGSSTESSPLESDLNALGDALESGDLSSAQSIFANMMQQMQGPPPSDAQTSGQASTSVTSVSGTGNGADSLADDLSTLAEALQSGDLSSAEDILKEIMANLEASGSTDGTDSSSASSDTSTSTASASGANTDNPLARDLSSLEDALSSGDLESAQSIFTNIMQHMQGPPPDMMASSGTSDAVSSISGSGSSMNSVGNDLSSLSDALLAGDLTSAKNSFAQLLEDLQASNSTDSTTSSATATSTTETTSSEYNLNLEKLLGIWAGMAAATQSSTINTSA